MRVNGPAVFVAIANLFSEHVRYWLGVGRRLHNDRRGGLDGSCAGVKRGHRADHHRSGGHLRRRSLRLARVLNTRSLCYGLCECRRGNQRASKSNSYSSHGFPFIDLTIRSCFAGRGCFGCLPAGAQLRSFEPPLAGIAQFASPRQLHYEASTPNKAESSPHLRLRSY